MMRRRSGTVVVYTENDDGTLMMTFRYVRSYDMTLCKIKERFVCVFCLVVLTWACVPHKKKRKTVSSTKPQLGHGLRFVAPLRKLRTKRLFSLSILFLHKSVPIFPPWLGSVPNIFSFF